MTVSFDFWHGGRALSPARNQYARLQIGFTLRIVLPSSRSAMLINGVYLTESGSRSAMAGGVYVTETVTSTPSVTYQYARPSSDISANGWTASTGSDLYAMVDEVTASATDYIRSPNDPTTQEFEVKLSSLTDPLASNEHHIDIMLEARGADTTFDFKLMQGASQLDSWSEAATVAEGAVTRTRDLTGTVADSITDYSDLRVRGVARAP